MKIKRLTPSIGLLAALSTIPALAQQTIDTIVTHGRILAVDAGFLVVEAFAIDAGRIVPRGTSAEMARYGRDCRRGRGCRSGKELTRDLQRGLC